MKSYHHFTLEERECLSEKIKQGKGVRQIAREMDRSPSTISREIKRNWSKKRDRYHPIRATCLYIHRRKSCVRQPRLADEKALKFVLDGLDQYWSPEIISARWRMLHPDNPLSISTLYRSIKCGLLPNYTPKTHLRRRGKRRKKGKTQTIQPIHKIHDRPKEVELRIRLGDLEGDTLYGGIAKGCIVTLVDRTSRLLYSARSETRERGTIKAAFKKALGEEKPKSITLDNGSEFADFKQIEKNHETTIYFADPHSPWQRGANENINGLLRFFFPKGTNFHNVSDEELERTVALINNRPRKCLGWLSPIEFISAKCCN
jgi:IS30 family transposase